MFAVAVAEQIRTCKSELLSKQCCHDLDQRDRICQMCRPARREERERERERESESESESGEPCTECVGSERNKEWFAQGPYGQSPVNEAL